MSPRVGRLSLVDEVTQTLLERLANGEYLPDDRLPAEQDLCNELNVSRTCLREAIRSLEILNVVEVRHGTGTFVKKAQPDLLVDPQRFHRFTLDRNKLLQLLELRLIIEVESAGLAAERATLEEIEILAMDVAALEIGAAKRQRPTEDMGFHLDIARATHNPAIAEVSRGIVAFYEVDPLIPDERDVTAHRRIYEAIRDRQPQQARQEMRAHLEEVLTRFRRLMDNDTSTG